MSNSPILSVAALLVAGLAICLQLLGTGESAPAPAPVSRGLEPSAELLARLDEIHASQLRLEERVSMLEVRDGGSRLPASVASQEELEELREELLGSLEGSSPPKGSMKGGTPSPDFTEQVEISMKEIQVNTAREKAASRVDQVALALEGKLPEVANQLGLTANQEASLESSLMNLHTARANYSVLWASGEISEKSEFGPIEQANMATFMGELESYLTPQQLQEYLALDGRLFPGGGNDGGK